MITWVRMYRTAHTQTRLIILSILIPSTNTLVPHPPRCTPSRPMHLSTTCIFPIYIYYLIQPSTYILFHSCSILVSWECQQPFPHSALSSLHFLPFYFSSGLRKYRLAIFFAVLCLSSFHFYLLCTLGSPSNIKPRIIPTLLPDTHCLPLYTLPVHT